MKTEEMTSGMKEYKSADELRREIADLKIQLAFQEQHEREVSEILEECENPSPELTAFIQEEEKGLLDEIDRHFKRRRISPIKGFLGSTAGKVAAVLIAGVLISFSSAMGAVQLIRIGAFRIDTGNDERYISVSTTQTEQRIQAPVAWNGEYYPSYIPAEFVLERASNSGGIWYTNADGNKLGFDEVGYEAGMNFDAESADMHNVEINGIDAFLIEKNKTVTIIWSMGSRCLLLELEGEKEVALQIAESVRKVEPIGNAD